jgi:hypothetical protein
MARSSAAVLLALVCLVAVARFATAYSTTTIYGNIYTKECHSCVGKESMHFVSATDSYMNYGDSGLLMSDGTKAPAKQPFTKMDFSVSLRRLTATVDFAPKSIVIASKNVQKIVYDVTFATDFQSIRSGSVRGSATNTSATNYNYNFCDDDMTACPSFLAKQTSTGTQYHRYIRYKIEEFDVIKDETKILQDAFKNGREHDQAHISFIFFNFCLIIITSVFSCLVYRNIPR